MCYVPAFRVNHFLLPEYRRKKVSDGKRASRIKHKVRYFLMWQTLSVVTVPKHSFLENVKNLMSHDKGNTFKVIKGTLEELRYSLHYLVMDGQTYVPQHRERIMIVGFNQDVFHGKEQFAFPEQKQSTQSIKEILDP